MWFELIIGNAISRRLDGFMNLQEFLARYGGRVIGIVVAVIVWSCIAKFGFWRSLFLGILIYVGYLCGRSIDSRGNIGSSIGLFFDRWMRR